MSDTLDQTILRGMVRLHGGTFLMGSASYYPEERPVREAGVGAFWIDAHPVTVAQFRRFVKATGYVTVAERAPAAEDYPGADPEALVPGALVFTRPARPVGLDDWRQWWSYCPGAQWRHPHGPRSTTHGRELHPVTQVAFEDARAYAAWAGKGLPTEAEWEYAARGGLVGAEYAWGDSIAPKGRRMANTWEGRFPWQFLPGRRQAAQPDTTPVRAFPANPFGLYDMIGNVWEWTADRYALPAPEEPPATCCAPQPRQPEPDGPADADGSAADRFPRRVTKGGSYLCAPDYCARYRPAARQGQTEDTATCHLGFRCVVRDTTP
ncbi:formylglycine-generating enzyme family protein [Streptacidiphilus melanogenes]|uniref:formylglycine-generating enzyme family protein n=1 Tax=Streptacidiphilus melanogenes TaxID=411235 RepID=UPI000A7C3A4B|nr:formylglycine-generating enzyme family protein [Streptacidiphilus melanogenes]